MKRPHQTLITIALSSGLAVALTSVAKADAPLNEAQDTPPPSIEFSSEVPTQPTGLAEDYEEQPQTVDAFLADAFNLSESQQGEIRAIFSDYQPRIEQSFQDYLGAVERLNSALTPATDNRVLVRARSEVVSLEQQTYDLLFERNIAIREVLNPNQRTVINTALRDLLGFQPLTAVEPLPFPTNLIGQNASEVVDTLVADGWFVVARTPRLVQLDKDNTSLDLIIDGAGIVDETELR
jgi:Spy/CpxP family protein refolding chaperone